MQKAAPRKTRRIIVRRSGIHGRGVFATAAIPGNTRLIEYKGERVVDDERDADDASTHTFLFMLDEELVIDGSRNGNSARWINHCCEPNCEAVDENGRVFIETLRAIEPGEEITIDYNLYLEVRYTAALKRQYACRCGAGQCRGTMLEERR
jgi:SET domain-containing protein